MITACNTFPRYNTAPYVFHDGCCLPGQVEDLPVGLFPVDTVRDPRICRLWSKCIKADLSVAKFKVIFYQRWRKYNILMLQCDK